MPPQGPNPHAFCRVLLNIVKVDAIKNGVITETDYRDMGVVKSCFNMYLVELPSRNFTWEDDADCASHARAQALQALMDRDGLK